ncbi:MAG: ATP-dependent DNA helicase RecG, partial [Pseudomonadota bacterium]
MSQRDERLFPLFRSVEALPKIGKKSAEALGSKGISRVMDLLMVLPRDGIDRTPVDTVMGQDFPTVVTVPVTVVSHQPGWRKDAPHKVLVDDAKTRFQLVFFRTNADWLQKQLPVGAQRIISGQAELYDNQVQITHPDYILDTEDNLPRFEPIYPALGGLAPKNIRLAINAATQTVPDLEEWIPNAVLSAKDWASWSTALRDVHHPSDAQDLNLNAPARVRLAFDELLAHQIALHLGRKDREKPEGVTRQINMPEVNQAKAALPFDLTNGQSEAVTEILSDISSNVRMNRMLQGDVGAGKTAVGFLAMAAMASAGEQSVMMAPTEVLARQHANELATWCNDAGLTLACLTGRNTAKECRDILAKLAEGEIDILVGTHAVFEDKVVFKKLGLAVIDEQHRFGVAQRKRLADKGHAVDVLIMTATPIPRSLALTHFGDMDVSLLTEKPAGRRPIDTVLVSMDRTDEIVSRLRAAIAKDQQAYWVCPLVSDSPILDKTAAESRFIKLKKELGSEAVALVHGQMSGEEKEAALTRFANGEAKVLVATTV